MVGEEGGGVADLAALGLRQEQVHEHEEAEQQQAEGQHDEVAQVRAEHGWVQQGDLNILILICAWWFIQMLKIWEKQFAYHLQLY